MALLWCVLRETGFILRVGCVLLMIRVLGVLVSLMGLSNLSSDFVETVGFGISFIVLTVKLRIE